MSWTPPSMQRHEALSDFLRQMGLDYAAERTSEIPLALCFEGYTMALDPWERGILQTSFNGGPLAAPWAPLLAEGLALQMKYLVRSAAPDARIADTAAKIDAVDDIERVIVDTAVGLALMRETQHVIDQLVVGGEMADAKKLTAFRNRIVQLVSRLKDEMGDDAYARAENKGEGMVAPVNQAPLVSRSTGPDPSRAGAAWKHRPAPAAAAASVVVQESSERRDLTRPCAILLGVLVVVWSVMVLPRFLHSEPPPLQPRQFAAVPGVAEVVARPPAVYITVDAKVWDGMTGPDRKQQLVAIGKIADEAGYVGADVRDGNGNVIGRWLKAKGTTVAEGS